MESIIWLIVGAVVGIAAGFVINKFVAKSTAQRAADEAHTVVEDAKRQAETLRREAVVEAKDEALRLRQEAQAENKERLKEVRAAEQRVNHAKSLLIAALSRLTRVRSLWTPESIRSLPCKASSTAVSAISMNPKSKSVFVCSKSRA